MAGDIIFYQFSRSKVEQCDFTHFLPMNPPALWATTSDENSPAAWSRTYMLYSAYDIHFRGNLKIATLNINNLRILRFQGFKARTWVGRILTLFAPDKLPTGRRLREMMNSFVFGIEGWDADPREIHMIPEIRRFYAALHDAWPYWLYFCNLDGHGFRCMTLCCLPSVNTMQVDGKAQVAVTCDPLDLLKFLSRDFTSMNLMCETAEMSERGIYDRTQALFEYFNLPFDGEPPPNPAKGHLCH